MKTRKLSTIAIISLLYVTAVHSMDIVNNIKRDINIEFQKSANAPVMIVTVERARTELSLEDFHVTDQQRSLLELSEGASPRPYTYASLISHSEFREALRLLYGACVNTRMRNMPDYTDNGVVLGVEQLITSQMLALIDDTIRDFKEMYPKNNVKNTSKLIIFSESFFSGTTALDEIQKGFIENKLLNLSRASKYGIFYPNFLYTKIMLKKGTEVYADLLSMGKRTGDRGLNTIRDCVQRVIPDWGAGEQAESSTINFKNMSVLERCAENILRRVPYNENLVVQEYLFNETYALYGGEIVTKTTKFGYQNDCNEKISQGCIYLGGSGNTEATPVSSDKESLQNILLQNITVDLEPVDSSNPLSRMENRVVIKDTRLHILQPFKFLIDPERFFSCNLPYIDENGEPASLMYYARSVSSEFPENTYKFTFLKM